MKIINKFNVNKKKIYYEANKEYILKKKHKKYNEDNKQYLLEKRRINYETNKEVIHEKIKEYREANKDKIKENYKKKYTCMSCNCEVLVNGKNRHEKNKKHMDNIT
jgi:hypothetical protein